MRRKRKFAGRRHVPGRTRKKRRRGRRALRSVKTGRRKRSGIGRRRPNAPNRHTAPAFWSRTAFAAGKTEGARQTGLEEQEHLERVRRLWRDWYDSQKPEGLNWNIYHAAASSFLDGYYRAAGLPKPDTVLLPTQKSVAAIVSVMNEEQAIPGILEQLHRLPLHEMIFVVNGSQDESFRIVRTYSRAWIVHYPKPLGHDVGRAIGAELAQSDILVFLDGDFPIPAEQLVPFIAAIENGCDIALNDMTPFLRRFSERDNVTIVKQFLNRALGRPDLHANSLTAVPHALSKRAAERIGYRQLIVPPKAQAVAILHGLKIACPISVDVVKPNRIRSANMGAANPVSELIVGDHIEALKMAMDLRGNRLAFPDRFRHRPPAGGSDR